MKLIQIITILILIIGCFSFKSSKIQLQAYYFPIEELIKPKVYKYADLNDENNTVYWRLSTEKRKDGIYFITRGYNNERIQIEFFEEKITSKGAIVTSFIDIYDTKTQKDGRVEENEVFIWNKKKTYSFKIFVDTGKYIFEKEQTPTTKKISKSFNGNTYDCIIMDDLYITKQIENEQNAYSYKQETYYAKGIGIIGYKRWLPNGTIYDYHLSEIIDTNGFEVIK